eukprot:TRINITY_DN44998_c1_g1_i1.p1 TRINITY_DN44998_c1_g1~~TRINITY_DN44998_c1_g1_i1.p1  ORF type:complete len:431 (-),score=59.79 TRINITY_DN44998_c1_g1_i1:303-1595(-)
MADEFHTGSSGGNWWGASRTGFSGSSSACSTALSDVGSFGWSETAEMKLRSCDESTSVSSSSIRFQDTHRAQAADSTSCSGVLMDSTAQMTGFNHPVPSTVEWSQALLRRSARAESSFHAMLHDDLNSRVNYHDDTGSEQRLISSDDAATICQGSPSNSFSLDSSSYRCPSMVLQGLTDRNPQLACSPYYGRMMNYATPLNHHVNSNEFSSSSSWSKFPHEFIKNSPPKQQQPNQLHFSNNTPFWNATAQTIDDVKPNFYPSSQNQFLGPTFGEKPNCSYFAAKTVEETRDSSSTLKKSSSETPYKRTRNETTSQLPTFKVRKEKLGDRITTLQQLVSPFGKTDTASVLFEAIEYIKFLHDQVSVLSTPYMKTTLHTEPQQNSEKSKEAEGSKQDLRSHGLCLVPVSVIIPVASETANEFWTPTYGGTFR